MPQVRNPNNGPYCVSYKWMDYDAEIRKQECQTWADCCRFMRQLLVDGYEITGVAFC